MKSINLTFAATLISLVILSGCTQNPEVVSEQPSQQMDENTQIIAEVAPTLTNTYSSPEHNFSLEYPVSWQIIKKEGVIITANDEKDPPWGGTNLNLQYDFTSGDVGMGWKEIKKSEEYINPQGLKFTLFFNSPDENFAKFAPEDNTIVDPNDIIIQIGTDAIPGLLLFSYNKTVNPDGEQQLMDILKTVSKNTSEQSSNIYPNRDAKIGETYGQMILEVMEKDSMDAVYAVFKGDVELTGSYQNFPKDEPFFSNLICFTVQGAEAKKLPQSKALFDEKSSENFFCFINNEQAKKLLGTGSGTATITISNFSDVIDLEGEAWDNAVIEKVVTKTEKS